MNPELEKTRLKINEIDRQLVPLFCQRMGLSAEIAKIKKEAGLALYDAVREKEVLDKVCTGVNEQLSPYLKQIYQCLMDLSKDYQRALSKDADTATFPEQPASSDHVKIACQGVPGAFSGEAALRMFPAGKLVFTPSWEAAFQLVADGQCDFAVLPVENSLAGSVGQVYDLLLRYRLLIGRACRLPVEHHLLALPGATLDDVTEIYSHPQALSQCAEYCSKMPLARTIPLENTAAAAKMVAALGDIKKAAIASKYCADLYGLSVLAHNIQTDQCNTTRFVAVTKKPYDAEQANKISLVFSLPHHPGALDEILSQFASLDLNLTKIESRPVSGKRFEYYFYLDFAGNTAFSEIRALMEKFSSLLPSFTFLGNYQELD